MTTTLLAANDGGHIMQLWSLSERFGLAGVRHWVTMPTPQTESMLARERVTWVQPAPTRDWRAAVRNARLIRRLFQEHDFDRAISTGSSLAVSMLPQAAVRRIPAHYIESVTRTDGLSMSGRMLQRVPGIRLYVQWPQLAHGRWAYRGSVLDGYAAETTNADEVRRVVVSLGTSAKYGFRRLLDRLIEVIPPHVEVLWQTGCTDVTGLSIEASPSVTASELAASVGAADVVVAHAGAGIALTALESGKVPLLVPRSAARGEHVDDHQTEVGRRLHELGLAVLVDADDLAWDAIVGVAGKRVRPVGRAPRFVLDGVTE